MATTVKTALPDLDWPNQAVITVDSGDNLALVTAVNIHLSQDTPEDLIPINLVPPILTHTPQEAPGLTR